MMKGEWIKIEDKKPKNGQNVIAVGTWCGEVSGEREKDFMCIDSWYDDGVVTIDTDTYSTDIVNVTHWMPTPEHPIVRVKQ